MIFFMTRIIPPSNSAVELAKLQKELFRLHNYIPAPMPLLITSIEAEKPEKPTRKKINELFVQRITFTEYSSTKNSLFLKTETSTNIYIDKTLPFNKKDFENGMILSSIQDNNKNELSRLVLPEIRSFSNYSLACYKVKTENSEPFWLNMEWEKLWEVKKGKMSQ